MTTSSGSESRDWMGRRRSRRLVLKRLSPSVEPAGLSEWEYRAGVASRWAWGCIPVALEMAWNVPDFELAVADLSGFLLSYPLAVLLSIPSTPRSA